MDGQRFRRYPLLLRIGLREDDSTLARSSALVCTEPSSFASTIASSIWESRALVSPDLYAWFHNYSRATIFDWAAASASDCV